MKSDSSGVFLYGRVMTFAECAKMHVPADEPAADDVRLPAVIAEWVRLD